MWYPSPNFGERRCGVKPDMVVLHYTAMSSAEAALDRLCDPATEVSCHYLIGRCGTCWQLVDEAQRAWHAGAGSWGGRDDVNSHSIGVELDNDGASPFSALLMARLETLLPEIMERWSVPPERVVGHSDIAPGRKIDPGNRLDWRRLALRELACWPSETDETDSDALFKGDALDARFLRALRRIGYSDETDMSPLLDAFRSRFRQGGEGALSPADIVVAEQLAARFPVDPACPAA